ncbi:MAG: cation diffusion facilitator family transporter [SAR324 cluster bacterium]|nr:cation diffusion facilitator family transporter [SAR324 cluster bacterium]
MTTSTDHSAIRITWIGVIANLLLTLLKLVVGVIGKSSALIADAAHSLSDLLTDAVALWALKVSQQPKDQNHPYGHGKFESMGTLIISSILFITGVGIAWQSLQKIDNPVTPDISTLWAALISIVVKEWMYHATVRVGKRTNSQVLIANAWHHRSDAISSVAAFIGIGLSQFGYPVMDPVTGVLVALIIIKMSITLSFSSARELTDTQPEEEVNEKVDKILQNIEEVVNYHEIRARKMGPYLLVDLHIQVDSAMSVSAAHQVAQRVQLDVLKKVPIIHEVLVHVDAEEDTELVNPKLMRSQKEIEREILDRLQNFNEIDQISHILCHFLNNQLTVQITINLNPDMTIRSAYKIAEKIQERVNGIEDVEDVDVHLELSREHKFQDLKFHLPQT